jgi:hypothetical protein
MSTTAHPTPRPHRLADGRVAAAGALALVAVATAFANFAGNGDNGGAGPYAIGLVVCGVAAALLFGRTLPATERPDRLAWVLDGFALLSILVFWSGLPIVFGIGAIAAAARAGRTAPAAVGGVLVVAGVVACVIG